MTQEITNFINGRRVVASGETDELIDPSSGEAFARAPASASAAESRSGDPQLDTQAMARSSRTSYEGAQAVLNASASVLGGGSSALTSSPANCASIPAIHRRGQLNHASHLLAFTKIRNDPRTAVYIAKQRANGKTSCPPVCYLSAAVISWPIMSASRRSWSARSVLTMSRT